MTPIYDFALRGRIFTFTENPFLVGDQASYLYYTDGVVLIKMDRIVAVGNFSDFEIQAANTMSFDSSYIIMPGFVDTHLHYPQMEIIGGYGEDLLQWLDRYAFRAEMRYEDEGYAYAQAKHFLLNLIDNGITSASVFGSSHASSVKALFEAADESNLHITAGQVWMDRNAPESLLNPVQKAYDETEALIKQWHNQGNLRYALTPRFAITSSPEQLEAAQSLLKHYPDLPIQSHISENKAEVAKVKELYPQFDSYAKVYDHYGLLTPNAIYGHGNLLTDEEIDLLADRGSSIAHCPSSNEFLGNSPLDLCKLTKRQPSLKLSLASDIGAGTSLTPWDTMAAAYRASRVYGNSLSPIQALYLQSLGGAKSLGIDHVTGKLAAGYKADIAIINTLANRGLAHRMKSIESLEEELFVLMSLGSTRTVERLYVSGIKLK